MENKEKKKLPGWAKVSIVLLAIAILFTIFGLPAYVAFGITGLLGVLILIVMSIILAIRKRKFLGSTLASFVFMVIAFTSIGSTPPNDKSDVDEPAPQPEVVEALANDDAPVPEEVTDKNEPDKSPASEEEPEEKASAEPISKPEPEPETIPDEALAEEEPHDIIDVDYVELQKNPGPYEGKFVRLSGKIVTIAENFNGGNFLTFRDSSFGITNYIYINLKESPSLLGLNEGDYITVVGKAAERMLGSVDINNPIIESKGEEAKKIAQEQFDKRTPSVTAIQLINTYEENEVNADNLYKNKMIKVSGTVDDIGKNIAGQIYVILNNGNPYNLTTVQCFFSKKDDDQINKVADLRKGDSVVVVGTCTGKSLTIVINNCKIQ